MTNPPSLTRIRILKFMLSRINEPLSYDEIQEATKANFTNTRREIAKLRNDKFITPVKGEKFKMTFDNVEYITNVDTKLAVVCDFSKLIKKKLKEYDKRK